MNLYSIIHGSATVFRRSIPINRDTVPAKLFGLLDIPGVTSRNLANRRVVKTGISIPLAQLEGKHKIGDELKMVVEDKRIILEKVEY